MKIAVIGGGIAGLGLARDLRLRGLDVVLIEKNTLGSGTSTNNAGVLHSGARYAVQNMKLAKICAQENKTIQKIAPFATSNKKAYFLVHKDTDKAEIESFIEGCKDAEITLTKVSREDLSKKIKGLNKDILYGFEAPDVVVDFSILIAAYVEDLKNNGVKIISESKVISGKKGDSDWKLTLENKNGKKSELNVDFIVTTAGSDSDELVKSLGAKLEIGTIEGSMFKAKQIFSEHVVTLCGPNIDGNVIVPLEDGCLIGSTWKNEENADVDDEEIIANVKNNARLMIDGSIDFILNKTLTASRTHLADLDKGRSNIDYAVVDHQKDGIDNLVSVLPGKFVLHRFVAEKAGDLICKKMNQKKKSLASVTKLKKPVNTVERKVKFQL